MGTIVPKQFLELAGKPVLMHAIERFFRFNSSIEIIVVLPENHFDYWEELRMKYNFTVTHKIVKGGAARFHSVKNGLDVTGDSGLVAIHDGVRPLVSTDTIRRCFDTALVTGNAIPAVNPSDSIRMITRQGNIPVNREHLRLVQTPQVFSLKLIKKAYSVDYSPEFTDDAMILERTGELIHLVDGNRENIKITNPEDLALAGALIGYVF
jgi:2-C-methyl-D-erythritol 4-phosphate cytidylyltransferase